MSLIECSTCGKKLHGSVWCDSQRELLYGGGECRDCYALTHPICNFCGEFLYKHFIYCPYCGKQRISITEIQLERFREAIRDFNFEEVKNRLGSEILAKAELDALKSMEEDLVNQLENENAQK
jgi:uncharacterized Zn finger protein (UPF0148 family)